MIIRMNIKSYLHRIKYDEIPETNLSTLFTLHKKHLLNVPFENLDIHLKRQIQLSYDFFFDKIVLHNRGGFCYELNGLFYNLLVELGYNAKLISARVKNKQGDFSQEFDHMAIIIELDDNWLVDVGFGDSFTEPLKLELDAEQIQNGTIYKIVKHNGDYLKLIKSEDGINFSDEYIFTLIPRKLSDYQEMCEYHQTSENSHFTQKKICTILTEGGRVSLTDDKLIITNKGKREEYILENETDFNINLLKYFNIKLN